MAFSFLFCIGGAIVLAILIMDRSLLDLMLCARATTLVLLHRHSSDGICCRG